MRRDLKLGIGSCGLWGSLISFWRWAISPTPRMHPYRKYTGYRRYVDFKKLEFVIQTVTGHFAPGNALRGLDLGCGEGNITIPLAAQGYQMVGVDISPASIQKARLLANAQSFVDFFVGDAENLAISQKVDFVICSEVLEHLKNPEKALDSISYVLEKGGILVCTVPNGYGLFSLIFDLFRNRIVYKIFPKIGRSEHIQAFTLGRINKLLGEAGFKLLKVRHSDFVSFLPLLVRSNRFCNVDCKLADRLPPQLVSGWYLACQKG